MRRLIALLVVAPFVVALSAQTLPPSSDGVPSVTDPSVPLNYVGNDGSVSLGINREGQTEGQLLGVFARNNERAVVGQFWWDRTGAGGVQSDYNWLWGMTAQEARERPDAAMVARLSFAVDQNADHDRKATFGFGIERRDFSLEGYLAHGISSARNAGGSLHSDVATVAGSDTIGNFNQIETTTVETLFSSKPYGGELGLQLSHVFEPLAMRVHAGASVQDGDGASANTLSLGLDTPLGTRGWGLSALGEHIRKHGGLDPGSDDRLSVFLRYEFGGHGSFVAAGASDDPAWIARSLGRPSSAHPRVVESYRVRRSQTVAVTRGPKQYTNHFPLLRDDSASTLSAQPVTIAVLANDSDPDNDPLALTAVTPPAQGTATIAGTQIIYTPSAGFSGTDSFRYTASDGRGGSANALVTITVAGRPDQAPVARDDTANTAFGRSATIAVLANDTDPDGDALVVTGVGTALHGTVAFNATQVIYTPEPGFSGNDRFTYTISDGRGGTSTATVTVVVAQRPNRAPVARDDTANTAFDTAATIAVLANDLDADGDALLLVSVTQPLHGSVTISGSSVVYTPAPGYAGIDTFRYTISDGHGGTDSATVTVTIAAQPNRPPVAVNDTATTAFAQPVTIAVLANDSDPDGDPLTITSVTVTPGGGTAVITGSTVLYTPPVVANGGQPAPFTYTISDGRGGTATATVTVTLTTAPNQPPVAVDDAATTLSGQPTTIAVLANDSDPDGDALSLVSTTAPAHGTVAISGSAVAYTPAAGYVGIDTFRYTVSDGRGGTASATVTVTIAAQPNRPPVAVNDTATTVTGQPVTIAVLANDSDPDGDPLTITAVTVPPGGGTAVITGASVLYTPPPVANGAQPPPFTYTISDGRGGTATATVTVTVTAAPNQPPVAVDDAATAPVGQPTTIAVLANDSDPDGDPLTIIAVTAPIAGGTAVISGTTVIFTSGPAGAAGTDRFTYTISDGRGGTATATVVVTVTATPNQPPVAVDDAATAPLGQPTTIAVLANDSDPDGDPLTITAVTAPIAGGTAVISGTVVIFTPGTQGLPTDRFSYTISDGRGGTATATVIVTIAAQPNQPPVAVDDTVNTAFGQPVQVPVLANDSDPDGDPLSIAAVTAPLNGVAVISGTLVIYTPNTGYSGIDRFAYAISDGRGGTASAFVTVVVAPAPNQPPVAVDDNATAQPGTPVAIPVLANDTDPDGDPLTIISVNTPGQGTAVISGTDVVYTPDSTAISLDQFAYTISDGHGHTATATVIVTIL